MQVLGGLFGFCAVRNCTVGKPWLPGASAPSSEVGPTTVPRVGQRKEDQNFQTKALAVLAGLGM